MVDELKESTPLVLKNSINNNDTVERVPMMPKLSSTLGWAFLPFTFMCSWYSLKEQEEAVFLHYGKYSGVQTTPGCNYMNCWGREIKRVSKRKISIHLPETKVIDFNGNPIIVSAIVLYHIRDTLKSVIDIQNCHQFIRNQAQTVVKSVVSKYPYESTSSSQKCLKNESKEIQKCLVSTLQEVVEVAGANIISFQFDELSYAPEIAHGMLKRQQAHALIIARKKIVEGAVDIAKDAVQQLEGLGVKMENSEQAKLVTNVLTIICSENSGVQKVLY